MTAPLRVDPRQGLMRGVRAAVLTVPAVGAAALAHALADGCGSPMAIAAAAGVCWPGAVALLGARRRMPALVLWLLGAQLVSHVLLERLCTDVTSGQVTLLQHLRAGVTPTMLAMHLGAVLVTAALLARADAGLWTADALIRAASRLLRTMRALPLTPAMPVSGTTAVPAQVRCLRERWEAETVARRGPPGAARRRTTLSSFHSHRRSTCAPPVLLPCSRARPPRSCSSPGPPRRT